MFNPVFTKDNLIYLINQNTHGSAKVIGYTDGANYDKPLIIPAIVENNGNEYVVTTIDRYALQHCQWSHVIAKGIQRIEGYAFQYSNVKTVELHDCKYIGYYAFHECEMLTDVLGGDEVGIIGNGAFNNCVSLVNAAFVSSHDLDESIFRNCPKLVSKNDTKYLTGRMIK